MTPDQFDLAISATSMPRQSRTAISARLVLLDGLSARQAARATGITLSAVSRAVTRLRGPQTHCKTCGQELPR